MNKPDPRIDAYIAAAAPFARPLLTHLRGQVHTACPDAEETIKWGMPFFQLNGKILAHMAAFKAHCGFGFWKGRGVVGAGASDEAMGQFGRIASLADLPDPAELQALIAQAAALILAGASSPPAAVKKAARPAASAPDDLLAALATQPAAQATFDGFPPGKQREYIEWIVEAKRPETRAKRVTQAVEWLAEGKARNWKYEAC
jgi:uncharacterized protein YdeI (YjbR/CyaY-like superfamily)